MSTLHLPQQRGFNETRRRDAWWMQPLFTFLGLLAFIIYSTWAAFQGDHYFHQGYISPFYSPVIFDAPGQVSGHAWFGGWPSWLPAFMPASPALLILWAPGGFRFTCYYYRGAYYKAFWADPINCSVGEPRKSYLGERSFPLIIQNIHRYFLYLALAFILLLAHDAWKGMWFKDAATGTVSFGFGVGTLVLILNVCFLGSYTLGCHSLRHLVGGSHDCVSKSPMGKGAYDCVSCFNRKHMMWAWISLFWVGFSDVYVRLCSKGIWTDFHFTF